MVELTEKTELKIRCKIARKLRKNKNIMTDYLQDTDYSQALTCPLMTSAEEYDIIKKLDFFLIKQLENKLDKRQKRGEIDKNNEKKEDLFNRCTGRCVYACRVQRNK